MRWFKNSGLLKSSRSRCYWNFTLFFSFLAKYMEVGKLSLGSSKLVKSAEFLWFCNLLSFKLKNTNADNMPDFLLKLTYLMNSDFNFRSVPVYYSCFFAEYFTSVVAVSVHLHLESFIIKNFVKYCSADFYNVWCHKNFFIAFDYSFACFVSNDRWE